MLPGKLEASVSSLSKEEVESVNGGNGPFFRPMGFRVAEVLKFLRCSNAKNQGPIPSDQGF